MDHNTHTVSLREPFEYEDREYTQIVMDFGSLTGKDALDIEKEMRDDGIFFVQNEGYDRGYQLIAAAKASGIAKDVLLALPLRENRRVKHAARDYLISGKSDIADTMKEQLEKLDGNTAEIIENELRAESYSVQVDEAWDTRYCMKLAARAADLTEDQIAALPMNEFLNIKMAVRYFLVGLA